MMTSTIKQGTAHKVRGSLALSPYKKLVMIFRRKISPHDSDDRSDNCQPRTLPKDHPQDIARMRAKRDANANLPGALRN
jgi:hypothetical protein